MSGYDMNLEQVTQGPVELKRNSLAIRNSTTYRTNRTNSRQSSMESLENEKCLLKLEVRFVVP